MTAIINRERYLSPKELAGTFREHGLHVSPAYVRAMLKSGAPGIVTGLRTFGQFSRVLAWWKANPDFEPRAGEVA